MDDKLIRIKAPEEEELEKKQTELKDLECRLANLELDLATFRSQLRIFEALYYRVVGVKYAQLDQINAQIAKLFAKRHPEDKEMWEKAKQAQEQAKESDETVADSEKETKRDFVPSISIKELYHKLAMKLHPDTTTDPVEKERRTRVMSEVNNAYEALDEGRLQKIFDEWQNHNDSVKGESIGDKLVRIIRAIKQADKRIKAIDKEIKDLEKTELAALRKMAADEKKKGKDLLEEMAKTAAGKVRKAKEDLEVLIREDKKEDECSMK